ncbi:hypothetical protein PMIN02_013114 [Paraphaeosphaeria minitans]
MECALKLFNTTKALILHPYVFPSSKDGVVKKYDLLSRSKTENKSKSMACGFNLSIMSRRTKLQRAAMTRARSRWRHGSWLHSISITWCCLPSKAVIPRRMSGSFPC